MYLFTVDPLALLAFVLILLVITIAISMSPDRPQIMYDVGIMTDNDEIATLFGDALTLQGKTFVIIPSEATLFADQGPLAWKNRNYEMLVEIEHGIRTRQDAAKYGCDFVHWTTINAYEWGNRTPIPYGTISIPANSRDSVRRLREVALGAFIGGPKYSPGDLLIRV
jgi:hypothetical protein